MKYEVESRRWALYRADITDEQLDDMVAAYAKDTLEVVGEKPWSDDVIAEAIAWACEFGYASKHQLKTDELDSWEEASLVQ